MKLNLKYYYGEDKYSKGDIENDIIKYILNNNGNDYEEIFKDDMRWPIYYHLSSIRQNILSWYPFKKGSVILEIGAGMGAITEMLIKKAKRVVSVELSKRRATAIQERCKNADNLEIIVGNFNDVNFEEKFDYITLIGVLEYAPLFTNTENSMFDFLSDVKKLLKPGGKILIAIENRMGIKYLCGAEEDHTSIPYSGINGYHGISNVKTLDKVEMIQLIESLNMKYNFYYPYPNYKFPEIIFTDKFKLNDYDSKYTPYYSNYNYLAMDEINLYNQFKKFNVNTYFSNSFLIELSEGQIDNDIELIKFQNTYRKKEYQLGTIVKENEVIKYPLCKESNLFATKVYENHLKLKNEKYDFKIKSNNIIFKKLNYLKLVDIIFTDTSTFNKYLKKIVSCIKKSSIVEYSDNNIFKLFNIKVEKSKMEKMNFLKNGFLDLTFFNAFVDEKDDLIFIDQEWNFDYVPIEYIIYRNIRLASINHDKIVDAENLYRKYNIDKNLFDELESKFIEKVYKNVKNKFIHNYKIIDVRANEINYINLKNEHNVVIDSYNKLKEECDKLNKMYKELDEIYEKSNKKNKELNISYEELSKKYQLSTEELNTIYNSKTWRIRGKIRRIFSFIKIGENKNGK